MALGMAHNLKVVGSNPTPATSNINGLALIRLSRFYLQEAYRKQPEDRLSIAANE